MHTLLHVASQRISNPLREHNISDRTARLLTYAAAGLGLLVLIGATSPTWASQRKSVNPPPPPLPPPPLPPPPSSPEGQGAPQYNSVVEPFEGYASRWASKKALALTRCRMDSSVQTWPQMLVCALTYTFPEQSDWSSVSDVAWMRAAHTLVQKDLQAEVEATYPGVSNGWRVALWLQGTRVAQDCRTDSPAQTALCVAQTLYPAMKWPPKSDADPWQREFYGAIRTLVGFPRPGPIGTSAS